MITLLRRYWNELVSYDGGFALLMMDGLWPFRSSWLLSSIHYRCLRSSSSWRSSVWRDTRATSSGVSVTRLTSENMKTTKITRGRRGFAVFVRSRSS